MEQQQQQQQESSELVELTSPAFGLAELELSPESNWSPASSVSTLDLSNASIERNQAGHYICEASNELGKTRQSVYVNILCKCPFFFRLFLPLGCSQI